MVRERLGLNAVDVIPMKQMSLDLTKRAMSIMRKKVLRDGQRVSPCLQLTLLSYAKLLAIILDI